MTLSHVAQRIEEGKAHRPGYPLPAAYAGLPSAWLWNSTIYRMAQAKTGVISTGCRCKRWERVSLLRMYLLLGWNGSLWDCRPPCDHCGDLRHYMASTGPSTPARPMITGLSPDELPWQAFTDGWRCPDAALIDPVSEPVWTWRPRLRCGGDGSGYLVTPLTPPAAPEARSPG